MEINLSICLTCCRTKKPKKLTSIYTKIHPTDSETIADFILNLTQINFKEFEDLPENICSKCLGDLEMARNFKNLCIESYKYLRKLSDDKKGEDLLIEDFKVEDYKIQDDNIEANHNKIAELDSSNSDINLTEKIENKIECEMKDHRFNLEDLPDQDWIPNFLEESNTNPEREDKKKENKKNLVIKSSNTKSQCAICGKFFADYRTLYHHDKIHQNEGKPKVRKYECEICTNKFINKKNLVIHMRIHTGERPFKCKFCPKTYIHYTDHRRHVMSAHTGERPYVCKICGKGYVKKSCLTAHEKTHNLITSLETPDEVSKKNPKVKKRIK